MAAFLEERHTVLAGGLARLAARDVAPLPPAVDDDACRAQARALLPVLGGVRWFEPVRGPDLRACCLSRETLAAVSPLADAVFALQALGCMPLILAGSEEQRRRWLEPALAGEAMAAFAMTEAEAGSDVGAIATRARRDGGEWVLEGAKTLISNAGIADFYIVFAATAEGEAPGRGRSEPSGPRRSEDPGPRRANDPAGEGPPPPKPRLSCFLVPAGTPGLRFVRPLVLSAPHPLGELAFEECRLPADGLIGAEGAGLRIGLATLDRLRPTVAAAACGMARRALDEALAHAEERRQFGRPLADFQLVQEKLARMATRLAAARLLAYRAARAADDGRERITLEAAMAKAFATEAAQRIVDDAVQILGGRGVLADHPVDRLYRAVRALRIYEGTTEVQHLVIARELRKRHGLREP